MSVNTLAKMLPYGLLAFVGAAGWSMKSTALLTMVVLGTAGVAIGMALAGRPVVSAAQVVDLATLEEHERQHHLDHERE